MRRNFIQSNRLIKWNDLETPGKIISTPGTILSLPPLEYYNFWSHSRHPSNNRLRMTSRFFVDKPQIATISNVSEMSKAFSNEANISILSKSLHMILDMDPKKGFFSKIVFHECHSEGVPPSTNSFQLLLWAMLREKRRETPKCQLNS